MTNQGELSLKSEQASFLFSIIFLLVGSSLGASLLYAYGDKIEEARLASVVRGYQTEKLAQDPDCKIMAASLLKLPGVWDPGQQCCAIPVITRVVNAEGPTYGTCLNNWPPPSV